MAFDTELKHDETRFEPLSFYKKLWSSKTVRQEMMFEYFLNIDTLKDGSKLLKDIRTGYRQSFLKLWKRLKSDPESLLIAWRGEEGKRLRVAGLASMTSGRDRCQLLMNGQTKPFNMIELALYKFTLQWDEFDEIVLQQIPLPSELEAKALISNGFDPQRAHLFAFVQLCEEMETEQDSDANPCIDFEDDPIPKELDSTEVTVPADASKEYSPDSRASPLRMRAGDGGNHNVANQDSRVRESELAASARRELVSCLTIEDGSILEKRKEREVPAKKPLRRDKREKKMKNALERDARLAREAEAASLVELVAGEIAATRTRVLENIKNKMFDPGSYPIKPVHETRAEAKLRSILYFLFIDDDQVEVITSRLDLLKLLKMNFVRAPWHTRKDNKNFG